MGSYRDDLEAAHALIDSLRHELAVTRQEVERLERRPPMRDAIPEPERVEPRKALHDAIVGHDVAALVDSIPQAPEPSPRTQREIQWRSEQYQKNAAAQDQLWWEMHFAEFAKVWLDTVLLAGRLAYDYREFISWNDGRTRPGTREIVSDVLAFLAQLWRGIGSVEYDPFEHTRSHVRAATESEQLDRNLRRLEDLYRLRSA